MRALFAICAAVLLAGCTCGTVRELKDPSTLTPDGKAVKTRSDKALDYSVAISIAAKPETVRGSASIGRCWSASRFEFGVLPT